MTNTAILGLTVRDLLWESLQKHANLPAVGIVGNKLLTYGEIKNQAEHLAFSLTQLGLVKGDKVAILGPNSPNWIVSYFSLLSLGIISVPILPDFHASEIDHILKHASVKMIIVSRKQVSRLSKETITDIPQIMILEDFALLNNRELVDDDSSYTPHVQRGSLNPFTVPVEPEDLATLIYTSGTTGFSKGVMLSNSNLVTNIRQCYAIEPMGSSDVFLSMLPLSHTYENTVGMLLPLSYGASIHYLDKLPTAAVLLPALKKVRPTYIVSVPLVIEKIYKSQIKGKVDSSALLRILYRLPAFRKFFHRLAAKKLMATFGGRLKFFGIGGAKLDANTDRFLKEGGFPYSIGYGLTETSPLLSGTRPSAVRIQSAGKSVVGVELKINEPDPETGIGEIWARGGNVMQGYYNEPEITAKVLMPGGWFRTGDLGIFDRDGYLYIKGRLKNVILGASGENIYPEEIESVINRFQYVLESVVVEQKGKLVALVHFNYEELEKQFAHFKDEARHQMEKKIEEMKAELQEFVNSQVNRYSRVQSVIIQDTPFEKTATKKIKRFLYQAV
ncbi:MAG: long-chain fatty acid--CoA ligase [Porphyromonadaceae bacterium]|nr:MAG: long-chain fatty acid--CoA ligase [Porphyromonadaceae bacterium]